MSQDYEYTVMTPRFESVGGQATETCQLADIFGRIPVAEMRQVLSSEWARQQGWEVAEQDVRFRIVLDEGKVLQTVQVGSDGSVTVTRTVPEERVESSQASSTRAVQLERLRHAAPAGNLAINEVIAQTIQSAMVATAEQMGYLVNSEVLAQQQGSVYDLVLEVEIPA